MWEKRNGSPRPQMRRLNSDSLSFDDVKGTMTKDLELGTFNVVDKLLSPDRPMTINERLHLSFQDADIIPLFLQACKCRARSACCTYRSQENYVNMRPHSAKNDLHRLVRPKLFFIHSHTSQTVPGARS